MTFRRQAARIFVTVAGLVLTLMTSLTAPATASAWPNDTFSFSLCTSTPICYAGVGGTVVWGNRSAGIQGNIDNRGAANTTTLYLEAYAGSTKVDSDTRTAYAGRSIPFDVTLSAPNLVGGFDRVKLQVCHTEINYCTTPLNVIRDSVAQKVHFP